MHNLKTGFYGEILSDSALNYGTQLPLEDPRKIEIIKITGNSLTEKIIALSSDLKKDFSDLHCNSTDSLEIICQKCMNFLNHRDLQFNSREKFRNYSQWKESIKECILNNQKIKIIIPIFCNIGNPMKRFQITHITYAEKVTLHHLKKIADEGSLIYPGGFFFEIIADANFYSTPFMNSVIETENYINELSEYVKEQSMENRLRVIDIMDILKKKNDDFTTRFHYWLEITEKEEQTHLSQWEKSMLSSINLRYISEYEILKEIFSSETGNHKKMALKKAKEALIIYRSLKNAAADISWESLLGNNSIRATIHTKDIPVLGLRIYPEYKKNSRLLPYHGIGYFYLKNNKYKMKIMTEMEAVSIPGVIKIEDQNGITQGYISEAISEKYKSE